MAAHRTRFAVAATFASVALNCEDAAAASENILLPVPAMTIYPGDVITDQVLVDRDVSSLLLSSK